MNRYFPVGAFIVCQTISIGWIGPIVEQEPSAPMPKEILPSQVFLRVSLVHSELELIRKELGKPANTQKEINVQKASPREVYFQALTLFRKADRLCFEIARKRAPALEIKNGKLTPADVYKVVDHALDRLRLVKTKLNIPEDAKAARWDKSKSPNEVFRSIVQANRQLNLMLERRFAPSDVYAQVTLAMSYASGLLAEFPTAHRIPKTPALERRKTPADVYHRLAGCFEKIRKIADRSGLSVLELKPATDLDYTITPSDVYDIASLMVSELAHLHAQLKNAKPPIEVFYPGRKLPSHVFQRAGMLEAQLAELSTWVEKSPDWLRSGAGQR